MSRILTVTLNPALDITTAVDRVMPDVKLRCGQTAAEPGGGGVNVSRAIALLGGASTPIVAAGGPTGARLLDLLADAGLKPAILPTPGDVRESLTVTEGSTGRQFRFVLPGPDWSAADAAAATAAILDHARPGDLVIGSGSLPPGVAPQFWVALSSPLAGRGARLLLDTSGAALAAAAASATPPLAALRMDDAEAEALAGRPLQTLPDFADLAQALVRDGRAETALIGVGAEGTVIATAGLRRVCRPPHVPVVSRVGAGDSFMGAFALALSRGADPLAACVAGVGAAASAVGTPGVRLCEPESAGRYAAETEVRAV
jgi:6-phosphofructokinase 2